MYMSVNFIREEIILGTITRGTIIPVELSMGAIILEESYLGAIVRGARARGKS